MNILALVFLCVGALSVLITAPFALFMPYKAFDDTNHPVRVFLFVALCLAVPLSMAWCLYSGWQHYQRIEYSLAVQFAAYPVLVLVLGGAVITIATLRTQSASMQNASDQEASKVLIQQDPTVVIDNPPRD